MKAIITVIGKDKVGIIAAVSRVLADHGVNILDLSQTVMREYFTMIMLVDLSGATASFLELSERLNETGETMGLTIRIQREDTFKSMHEV